MRRLAAVRNGRLKKRFLESFARTGNITESCELVGIKRRADVYDWQEHDPAFVAAFREAEVKATEFLETEARVRATDGTMKPVFHQGEVVGYIAEKSDNLLMFLLKARNPNKYRDRVQMQHSDAEGERLPLGAVENLVRDALGSRN